MTTAEVDAVDTDPGFLPDALCNPRYHEGSEYAPHEGERIGAWRDVCECLNLRRKKIRVN